MVLADPVSRQIPYGVERTPIVSGRTASTRVHVIVPDDPGQPTGGNIYDRRVCAGMAEAGWDVLVWLTLTPTCRAWAARFT
jgi:hypothetical protein